MIKRNRKYLELILYGIFGMLTTAVNYGSYAAAAPMTGFPQLPATGS